MSLITFLSYNQVRFALTHSLDSQEELRKGLDLGNRFTNIYNIQIYQEYHNFI